MRVIPAIDLKGGNCVRLFKGRFDEVTDYSDDPAGIARDYEELEVTDMHIVDLDGARSGEQKNADVVAEICSDSDLCVQLGGGIRSGENVAFWLDQGVTRCVIGSLALSTPELFADLLEDHGPERLVLALDVNFEDKVPVVATHGWTRSSGISLWECIKRFRPAGLKHVLCTDISRDGALTGPNIELYAEIVERYPDLLVQASGGVRDMGDIRALADVDVWAAISGKALLEGRISAEEVRTFLQNG